MALTWIMLTVALFLGSALIKLEITDDKCGSRESQKAPGKPPNLRVIASARDMVSIAWDAPDPGTKPVEYYLVGMRDSKSKWKMAAKIPANTLATTFDNLIPNTKYQFRVRANSELGLSGYSQLLFSTGPTLRRVGADGQELDEDIRNDTVVNKALSDNVLSNETLNNKTLNKEALTNKTKINETLNKESLNKDSLNKEALNNEMLNQEELLFESREGGYFTTLENGCPEEDREHPSIYCFLVYMYSAQKGIKEEYIPREQIDEAIEFLYREDVFTVETAELFHEMLFSEAPSD